jgi:hypothetical protein
MDPLARVLSNFDFREHHSRFIASPPEPAVVRLVHSKAAPDLLTRALFTLRGIPRNGSIRDLMRWFDAEEVAPGVFVRRGRIEIAVAFWAEPAASGSTLHTETRVRAADRATRRRFRAYWLVVRPFSGLIRRSWLRAAASG